MRGPAVAAVIALFLLGACVTTPSPGTVTGRPADAPAVATVEESNSEGGAKRASESAPKGRLRSTAREDEGRFANPTGRDVAKILDESGLRYETVETDKRWMIAFAGEHLPRVVLYVIHGEQFTIVLGKLFTIAESTGPAFFRALARKNYDFDQLKLSVDKGGGVFASFEVPTRIVDKRELLENIFGLASAIDNVLPELVPLADPVTPSDDATEEEAAPSPKRGPPPPPPGSIIEARATGVRR